jgi:histone acetyltransferase (RNA polymerase elongator complex component)
VNGSQSKFLDGTWPIPSVSLFHLGQDHILIGNLLVLEIGLENLNHSEITNRYKQSHKVSLQQQKNNSLPNTHFTEHPCTTQQNSGKSEIFDELQNHKLNTKLVKSTMRRSSWNFLLMIAVIGNRRTN